MTRVRVATSLLLTVRSHVSERALVVASWVSVVLGGTAGFSSLLGTKTVYGLGYGLWFAGVVLVALAIVAGPVLGARVGGVDWDQGTLTELHLSGRSVFGFRVRVYGVALAGLLSVLAFGLLAAGVVSLLAALSGRPWHGDAQFVSVMAGARLALAVFLGLPFALACGWAGAIILRSSHRAAVVVEGSFLLYVVTVGWAHLSPVADALYRYSPWGGLMAMLVGGYRSPRLAVDSPPGLLVSAATTAGWLVVMFVAVYGLGRPRHRGR